jgi:hypothetical protein
MTSRPIENKPPKQTADAGSSAAPAAGGAETEASPGAAAVHVFNK